MRQFLILPVACAALLSAQTAELQNPRTSPEDVAQGAKTFRSHCATCHGLHGEGGVGPKLAAGRFYHGSTDAALLANISDGIAGTQMPGLFYSPDRVWQVIAYIRSLNQGATGNVPGSAALGKAVYSSSGCASCHRIQGEGGRLGPDLTQIGRSRAPEHLRDSILNPNADVQERYWVVEATAKDGTRYSGFLMNEDTYSIQFIDTQEHLRSLDKATLSACKVTKESRMPSFRGKLTDAQITDLVAYLSSLRPQGDPQ